MIYASGYYYICYSVISNPYSEKDYYSNFLFTILASATICAVDTFFLISGFLAAYNFIKHNSKIRNSTEESVSIAIPTIFMTYTHRLFRVLFAVAFLLFFSIYIAPYLGEGPIWNYWEVFTADCSTNWWAHLLFINNLYPTVFSQNGCMPWTWFIACDVQLFVVLIPLLVLTLRWRKLGVNIMIIAIITCLVCTGAQIFVGNYGGITPTLDYDYYSHVAVTPWARAPAYLLGAIFGVYYWEFIAHSKAKISSKYATIGARLFFFLKENNNFRYIFGYGLGFVLTSLCCFIPYFYNKALVNSTSDVGPSAVWSPLARALYGSLVHLLWPAGVLLAVIIPCLIGRAQLFSYLLGGEFWSFLSRLSYTTYLFYPYILTYIFLTTQIQYYILHYQIFVDACAFIVLSYAVAFVLSVTVELPPIIFERILNDQREVQKKVAYLKNPAFKPISAGKMMYEGKIEKAIMEDN